jgi:hypothetical protein
MYTILVTLFSEIGQAHESVKMPTKTADEHVKMRKQLRRMPLSYDRPIRGSAFSQLWCQQLKLNTDQQMIEELLEPTASIAEILMPCSKGVAFYKDKMTAADF